MFVITMGPPGAGKVLQADIKEFALPHISTGDIFRSVKKLNRGQKQKNIWIKSISSLMKLCSIVKERLSRPDCKEGAILDGFRTVNQAEALMRFRDGMKIDAVICIDADEDDNSQTYREKSLP